MTSVTALRDETRDLLIRRPQNVSTQEIADAIGVSTAWLNMFARGKIANPGVVTIETLNRYLKKVMKVTR